MKINRKIIEKLKPCKDRLENYIEHYGDRTFDVIEFLQLDGITHRDKLWVVLRLVDHDTKVVFAMDCALTAIAANTAVYSVDATDVYASAVNVAYDAAYAAYVDATNAAADTAYDVAYDAEQERQIEALIYLIGGAV